MNWYWPLLPCRVLTVCFVSAGRKPWRHFLFNRVGNELIAGGQTALDEYVLAKTLNFLDLRHVFEHKTLDQKRCAQPRAVQFRHEHAYCQSVCRHLLSHGLDSTGFNRAGTYFCNSSCNAITSMGFIM